MCGSAMEVYGSGFEIRNNHINYNGFAQGESYADTWSDGITLLRCDNSSIHNNELTDNTDVDLIVGPSTNCNVYSNTVTHSIRYGFAGVMVGFGGDHSGSTLSGNGVSSSVDQLAFGVMVGLMATVRHVPVSRREPLPPALAVMGNMIKHALALTLVSTVGACGSPTEPTPAAAPPTLVILAPSDGGAVGQQLTLTAVVGTTTTDRRTVAATWSSSAPDIAQINESGTVIGRRLGAATLTASFENQLAAVTLRVVSDFSGTWNGQYVVTDCTRLSGDGSSYCRFVVGVPIPLELSVTQRGTAVTGTLTLFSTNGTLLTTGPIHGESTVTGELRLSARVQSVGPEQPEVTDVVEWSSTLSQPTGEMTGRFLKIREFTNAFGPQKSREVCELRSAWRL